MTQDQSFESLAVTLKGLQYKADKSVRGYEELLHSLQELETRITTSIDSSSLDLIARKSIAQSICCGLQPSRQLLEQEYHDDTDDGSQKTVHDLRQSFLPVVSTSLRILSEILNCSEIISDEDLFFTIGTAIATYTDSSELWSDHGISKTAKDIIEKHRTLLLSERYLVNHLLRNSIKPKFGKKPGTITNEGRKAIGVSSTRTNTYEATSDKQWREEHPETLTLLKFVIENLETKSIEANWPLIIPPILTTLDTGDVLTKCQGCQILECLLSKIEPDLLKRTGLGEVIWDAVTPCLHFLPPLTPLDISDRVIGKAFDVLILLAQTRCPQLEQTREKVKLLHQILREGVFQGMTYAGDNVKVVQMFMQNTRKLVDELKIYTLRHLPKLIALCNENFAAPFATAYPPLLQETITTMRCLIQNCWPRMNVYKVIILRGIVLCWIRISQESTISTELQDVRNSLRHLVELLHKVTENKGGLISCADALVEKNEVYKELFSGVY